MLLTCLSFAISKLVRYNIITNVIWPDYPIKSVVLNGNIHFSTVLDTIKIRKHIGAGIFITFETLLRCKFSILRPIRTILRIVMLQTMITFTKNYFISRSVSSCCFGLTHFEQNNIYYIVDSWKTALKYDLYRYYYYKGTHSRILYTYEKL